MKSQNYKIIADAGGTSTEWRVIKEKDFDSVSIVTEGINASVSSQEFICNCLEKLKRELQILTDITFSDHIHIYFFGAGCKTDYSKIRLSQCFEKVFKDFNIFISLNSDLEGAAIALFGSDKGIAAILGTGSSTGFYDGKEIRQQIPSLGYILGDEGSGAFMGKLLLRNYLKLGFTDEISCKLRNYADVSQENVIRQIYSKEGANKYLASFMPFILENEKSEEISVIINESLKLFFEYDVLKYKVDCKKIGFVGSVAFIFRDRITKIANENGYFVTKFLKSPIDALTEHYIKSK